MGTVGGSPIGSRRNGSTRRPGRPNRHSGSQATRHLCAGVYVDRSFRDTVIRSVHNDPRRRVAPSYGFDVVPVVRHAWMSWSLEVGQLAATAGCLCAAITRRHWLAVVFVMAAALACCMLRKALQAAPDLARRKLAALGDGWLDPGRALWPRRRRRGRRRSTHALRSAVLVCGAAATVLALASSADEDSLGEAARRAAVIGGLLVVFAAVIGALRQLDLNIVHRAETLRPAKLTPREEVIDEQQTHCCAVYRRPKGSEDLDPFDALDRDGTWSPFVGSGSLVGSWQAPLIVQLLRRGSENIEQREYTTPPFEAHELVDRLRAALAQVGSVTDVQNLHGLEVRDRLYVAETDVSVDRSLLDGQLSTDVLRSIIDDPQPIAHHFLEASVPLHGGELVITVFVRVGVKARNLSLYVAACALTRTPRDFQRIDNYAEHGWSAVVRSALQSVMDLPRHVWEIWRLAEVPLVLARAAWAAKDRTLTPRRGVMIGTRVAVRQDMAEPWENTLDRSSMYGHMRIIEQRVLKSTEGFLKDHDVDTSSFEKQATTIINSGVLTMGGKTEVQQSAIGHQAQVHGHGDGGHADGEGE